jgi:hypothetical protein
MISMSESGCISDPENRRLNNSIASANNIRFRHGLLVASRQDLPPDGVRSTVGGGADEPG